MSVICIDPGVNNYGLVLYKNPILKGEFQAPQKAQVQLVPRNLKDKSAFHKIEWLVRQMDAEIFQEHSVEKIYCEYPEYMPSLVGQAAMARGDILHLASFVGAVMGMAHSYNVTISVLEVSVWKGNMPKEMVNNRIQRAFDRAGLEATDYLSKKQSHDWDACGIGCFLMGDLT